MRRFCLEPSVHVPFIALTAVVLCSFLLMSCAPEGENGESDPSGFLGGLFDSKEDARLGDDPQTPIPGDQAQNPEFDGPPITAATTSTIDLQTRAFVAAGNGIRRVMSAADGSFIYGARVEIEPGANDTDVWVADIAAYGDVVYTLTAIGPHVAEGAGLSAEPLIGRLDVLDMGDASASRRVSEHLFELQAGETVGALAFDRNRDLLYVVNTSGTLHVFEIDGGERLVELDTIGVGGQYLEFGLPPDVTFSADRAYVSDVGRVTVIDTTDPSDLDHVAIVTMPEERFALGIAAAVEFCGDCKVDEDAALSKRLYVVDPTPDGGVWIADVTNPVHAEWLGRLELPGGSEILETSMSRMTVAEVGLTDDGGRRVLRIRWLDVTDPTAPTTLETFEMPPGTVRTIAMNTGVAIQADGLFHRVVSPEE